MLIGIGFLLAATAFWIAIWIVLPAPTYFLLTFSVGGPEISQWLVVGSLAALACLAHGALTHNASRIAQLGAAMAIVALIVAASVWVRLPGALRRFDREMQEMSADPPVPRRRARVAFLDLFRGIETGAARITTVTRVDSSSRTTFPMRIYRPPSDGVHPIVVQIYGAAWRGGEPEDNAAFATWLASAGYVVCAIDYRHAPQWRWPTQIDDVDDALRWIAAHATEWDGDTSRVVLLGRSAGAHLATMAAWVRSPIRLRGVVSFYGPADLTTSYRDPPRPDPINVRAVEEALLGGTLAEMPERYDDASPIAHLTHPTHLTPASGPRPPSLLIYGGRDHIVEARYGRRLVTALRATNTRVAYLEIPWADHAFDAVFNGPSSQLSLYYVERFLAWAVR